MLLGLDIHYISTGLKEYIFCYSGVLFYFTLRLEKVRYTDKMKIIDLPQYHYVVLVFYNNLKIIFLLRIIGWSKLLANQATRVAFIYMQHKVEKKRHTLSKHNLF